MAIERTLCIVKPNAVAKNVIGQILVRYEESGLRMIAAQFRRLSIEKAEGFYIEHKGKSFFHSLLQFMTKGPVLLVVWEGEDAVRKCRDIMGATDPEKAAVGTIRHDFGDSIEANAVHGSDSTQSAQREIAYFFDNAAIFARS